MRICVFNAKGGSGRTSIAINLAACYAQDDVSVLLADKDPQGSSLAWESLINGASPFSIRCNSSKGFDIEIIDMPPRIPENGVLPEADVYVIPTLLDGVSFIVFLRTMELINNKPYVIVANRVNIRRKEHTDRLKDNALKGAIVIHEKSAMAAYYAQGTHVFEMVEPHIKRARAEIQNVRDAIDSLWLASKV